MNAILPALLALLQTVAPTLGTSTAVGQAVQIVTQLAPVLIETGRDMIPMIKNIIEALRSNGAATAEQIAALQAVEAQLDADFDAAADAAEAEDAQG